MIRLLLNNMKVGMRVVLIDSNGAGDPERSEGVLYKDIHNGWYVAHNNDQMFGSSTHDKPIGYAYSWSISHLINFERSDGCGVFAHIRKRSSIQKQNMYKLRNKMLCALGTISGLDSSIGYCDEIDSAVKLISKHIHHRKDIMMSMSTEERGKFSYAKSKKDRFNSVTRVRSTFGRIVTRQFDIKVGDHILSEISTMLIAILWPQRVVILSGHEIPKAYVRNSSCSSCMTHNEEQTELYAINEDCVKLAVIRNEDGKTVARSLMFKIDDGCDLSGWVHDRTYGAPDYAAMLFDYFKENNIPDAYSSCCNKTLRVTMDIPSSNYVPYMDTFRNLDKDPCYEGEIVFSKDGSSDYPYVAQCTDGRVDGSSHCERCGESCRECDLRSVIVGRRSEQLWCEHCCDEYSVTCDHCENLSDGDECITVHDEAHCPNCMRDVSTCTICNENFHNCDLSTVEGEYVCCSCAEDNVSVCEECGDSFLTENMKEIRHSIFCDGCASAFIECAECGETFPRDEMSHELVDGGELELICMQCKNERIDNEEKEVVAVA